MNIKKIKKYILQTFVIVPVAIAVLGTKIYYETKGSEEYRVASNYVQKNHELKAEIGEIEEIVRGFVSCRSAVLVGFACLLVPHRNGNEAVFIFIYRTTRSRRHFTRKGKPGE